MRRLLLIVLGLIALAALALYPIARRNMHAEAGMTNRHGLRAGLAALGVSLAGAHTTAASAVLPTTIGVSVTQPTYYGNGRSLANLAAASNWLALNHEPLPPDQIDTQGNIKRLAPGTSLMRVLTLPNVADKNPTVRCTWAGKGVLKVGGRRVQGVRYDAKGLSFALNNDQGLTGSASLTLTDVDPTDPVRNVDCRETSMPAAARFDRSYLETVQGFKIIRFMDWQNTNENAPVTWQTRHLPGAIDTIHNDGVPIEDMIEFANRAGADPWFNMPWNADDEYYEHFARMVHASVPADRTVYVEMGNELWNHSFKASQQAMKEGVAANLAADPNTAGLFRYAQRLAHVMDIWSRVFADRPSRLVRVAACQNGDGCAKIVMGYKDTPRHVDALSTAPYFGGKLSLMTFANVDDLYAHMDQEIDRVLKMALQAKAVASEYGKRYIAYEGGQALTFKDLTFEQQAERDARMYDAYRKYIRFWRDQIGDVLMLWCSSGAISRYGGWGLVEYVGQPLSEAPKMRAVRDEMAHLETRNSAH